MQSNQKSFNITILGIFSAIVVVLQLFSYVVKIGTFNLSLVLVPIVLAAVLFGPRYSAILGAVFGTVTLLAGIFGLDGGCFVLWTANPALTTLVAIFKGFAAGLVAGLVANALKKHSILAAVVVAAATAPIVNTGLFCIGMLLFFKETLTVWAGGSDIMYYVIFGLTGVNFLIELSINMLLSPALITVSKAVGRYIKK